MHPPNSSNRYCGNGANGVSSNANTRSPEPTYCRKRFPGRRQRSFRYIHTPPKTQPSSNVFVSMLYSIVPADDKNTDGSGTHKPNATSQLHRNSPVAKIGDGQYGRGNDRKQI